MQIVHRPDGVLDQRRRSTVGLRHLSEIYRRLSMMTAQQEHLAKRAALLQRWQRETKEQAAALNKPLNQLSALLPTKHVYGQASPPPRAGGEGNHASTKR